MCPVVICQESSKYIEKHYVYKVPALNFPISSFLQKTVTFIRLIDVWEITIPLKTHSLEITQTHMKHSPNGMAVMWFPPNWVTMKYKNQ